MYGTIAIASGKGGTGKTTIAANLTVIAARQGLPVRYVDCDVEEPNGHLFLKPQVIRREELYSSHPHVDENLCQACGKCAQICAFSAIAMMGKKVITFPSLCHDCGGCYRVCPHGALIESRRPTGTVESGCAYGADVITGRLNIGEPMATPIIKKLKLDLQDADDRFTIIDSPPGTSCPVIQAIHGVDYVLLVTEPTPFGLHDLGLAVDLLINMGMPFGVVINRSGASDYLVHEFCSQHHVDVLAEISDDRYIAQAYSQGKMVVDALPEYQPQFTELLNAVLSKLANLGR